MSDFDLDIPIEAPKTQVINAERTQALEPVRCPVCDTENLPGEEWCAECGFLLDSVPGELGEPAGEGPHLVDDGSGREFALVQGANGIGREGPEIVLGEPSVSRRHAQIVWDDSGVWLEDLGSSNGTKVDGARLPQGERHKLKGGETLQLGNALLRAVIPGAEEVLSEEEPLPEAETAAWLIAVDGTEYAIPSACVTLGRRSGNGIVLSGDPFISGMHGQLLYEDGAFSFVDLGSTNGSLVNGARAIPDQPIALADGDKLTLGRTELVFKMGEPYALGEQDSKKG